MTDGPVSVGVIGVGSMGKHHVRVYDESSDAALVGVYDEDADRADEIAREYDTAALPLDELVEAADAVSIAVPTEYHYEIARQCLQQGVAVLIEKPMVTDLDRGAELVDLAEEQAVPLQVGHIERFNPAIETLSQIVPDLDVIAIEARRLGPDPGREIQDTVVTDLMIHDLDVLLSLVDAELVSTQASGTAAGRYATTTLEFSDGTLGSLTASRRTQQKLRELTITAADRLVKVDYIEQSVEIHRRSAPEYVAQDGDVRYRHESIVERPVVDTAEPLKEEIAAFLRSVRSDEPPVVSGTDALDVLEVVAEINEQAFDDGDDR